MEGMVDRDLLRNKNLNLFIFPQISSNFLKFPHISLWKFGGKFGAIRGPRRGWEIPTDSGEIAGTLMSASLKTRRVLMLHGHAFQSVVI